MLLTDETENHGESLELTRWICQSAMKNTNLLVNWSRHQITASLQLETDSPSWQQLYYLGLWRKKCRKAFWLAQGCRLTPSTLDITMCVRPIPTVTPTQSHQSHHTRFPAMDLTGLKKMSLPFNMAHLKSLNCTTTFLLLEKYAGWLCLLLFNHIQKFRHLYNT